MTRWRRTVLSLWGRSLDKLVYTSPKELLLGAVHWICNPIQPRYRGNDFSKIRKTQPFPRFPAKEPHYSQNIIFQKWYQVTGASIAPCIKPILVLERGRKLRREESVVLPVQHYYWWYCSSTVVCIVLLEGANKESAASAGTVRTFRRDGEGLQSSYAMGMRQAGGQAHPCT